VYLSDAFPYFLSLYYRFLKSDRPKNLIGVNQLSLPILNFNITNISLYWYDQFRPYPDIHKVIYDRMHPIMIKPSDVILYDGGHLLHGSTIIFEGQSFANMFCHSKPVDYVAPS